MADKGISRQKLILLALLAIVIIAAGITVALVFIHTSNNLEFHRDGVSSDIGNAVIEAYGLYTFTDNSSFGKTAGTVVKEIAAGETSFNYRALTARSQNQDNTVYLAVFGCEAKGQPDSSFPVSPSDTNCQGIVLAEYYTSVKACLIVAILESAIAPADTPVVMGNTFQNPGTYYAAAGHVKGCSYRESPNNWQQDGFPPIN